MTAGAEAAAPTRHSAWSGLTHRLSAQRGLFVAAAIFIVMFAYYGYMQPVGLSVERHQHGGQQGRALGAGRDGADFADPHRRHRSVGRHHASC